MTQIPKEKTIDSSLNLLNEGFQFIPNRKEQFNSKIFRTRIMFKDAICISGKEAAQIFYDQDKFTRKGVLPNRILKTLLGKKGVHSLDDEAHLHRKAMFMSLMDKASIQNLLDFVTLYWREHLQNWPHKHHVKLFNESSRIICHAACAWTGIPIEEQEVKHRANDFIAMIDAFGAVGPRHYRGKRARKRTEKWIAGLIKLIREGKLIIPNDKPAYIVAHHRDLYGELLDLKVASVELINLIRPTVAISYYVAFAALALYKYPEQREKIINGIDSDLLQFVQEVRRYYPFGPFLGAYARKDFEMEWI